MASQTATGLESVKLSDKLHRGNTANCLLGQENTQEVTCLFYPIEEVREKNRKIVLARGIEKKIII